jgi:hypothetical protein
MPGIFAFLETRQNLLCMVWGEERRVTLSQVFDTGYPEFCSSNIARYNLSSWKDESLQGKMQEAKVGATLLWPQMPALNTGKEEPDDR